MANKDEPLIVGLDTQTLIWALGEIASSDAPKEHRATLLLDYLSKINARVILSTIVIGELLTDIDPSKHSAFIASLEEKFDIVPFDIRGASKAAAMYRLCEDLKNTGKPNARKTFKADLMIVAQAWASGVTIFFSDDAQCRAMATRMGLHARELPTQPATAGNSPMLFEINQTDPSA